MTTTPTAEHAPEPGCPPGGPSLLIGIRPLSALLSRSIASLERDQAAGRLPPPVRIGGSRLWRRAEIEAWVKAGCPDAATWAALTGGK